MLSEIVIEWTKKWKEEGLQEGLQKGLQQGLQQGLQEGQKEGQAKLLIAQLEKKFGVLSNADRQRITSADPDTLLCWGERLMIAGSLKEVFD